MHGRRKPGEALTTSCTKDRVASPSLILAPALPERDFDQLRVRLDLHAGRDLREGLQSRTKCTVSAAPSCLSSAVLDAVALHLGAQDGRQPGGVGGRHLVAAGLARKD